MGKRNQRTKMSTTPITEQLGATDASLVTQNESATESDVTKDNTSEEDTSSKTFEEKKEIVIEEMKEEQKQPEIKIGSVVDSTSSTLGVQASPEKVKVIVNQKSVVVEPSSSKFEQKIAEIMTNGTSNQKMLVITLQKYIEEMKPGRIFSDTKIAYNLQKSLFNVMKKTVTTEDSNDNVFTEDWKLLVSFFRNNRNGALGGIYPFRFMEDITTMNSEEKIAFTNLINLLIISAGINNPKDVKKHCNLEKAIHNSLGESARQRVVNYYS